jgi:hypothetical protein
MGQLYGISEWGPGRNSSSQNVRFDSCSAVVIEDEGTRQDQQICTGNTRFDVAFHVNPADMNLKPECQIVIKLKARTCLQLITSQVYMKRKVLK